MNTNYLFDLAPGLAQSYAALMQSLVQHPEVWSRLQQDYVASQTELWHKLSNGQDTAQAERGDKRFSAPEWKSNLLFQYLSESYLTSTHLLVQAIDAAPFDEAKKRQLRFFAKQLADAVAPSNFLASNPEALRMCAQTNGASLAAGLQNLMHDFQRGRISMTDESAFEVGKNLAQSPGSVVFENELIQIIQYTPTTAKVHERPILLVPPCINKFYIMDLQPDNSFVRWAVEQGQTVFMLSWRNVDEAQQHLTWDDYLEIGVIKAIEVVRMISQSDQINVLGFCVGGTLVGAALGVLAARRQDWVSSLTLMTSMLDFSDVGDISAYVDENFVEQREREFADGGIMRGAGLAMAFSSLRPNELIWNYVVDNYLKGGKPPAFDLLYWNSDSTNLPGPMYAWYLRHAYFENALIEPGKLEMCGVKLDLGKVKTPIYSFAAIEDHIVPWRSAYRSAGHFGGKVEYVLGASGHIAGSMNSAFRNKRHFWSGARYGAAPDEWLEHAKQTPGSWWAHWTTWLAKHSGKLVAAKRHLGARAFPPIEAAPGRYVKQRAN